jgi:hypothetical protein
VSADFEPEPVPPRRRRTVKEPDEDLLSMTLQVAVAMNLHELDRIPATLRWTQQKSWADAALGSILHEGDAILYKGTRGTTANSFNHLARAVAALAYQPGGVHFRGTHWCRTDHRHGYRCTALEVFDLPCHRLADRTAS